MCPLASPRPFHSLLIVLLLTLMLAFPASAQTGSNPGLEKAGSVVLININKTKQEMTVFVDGIEKYHWPVSTGRAGYSTPSGTYTATSMNKIWYSKQWDNSPMPHSIFFIKDGHAIHGSYEVKNLGKPVSHGCVRISPQNANTLYALVEKNGLENTQVVLSGVTPGGEFKFATQHNGIYYDTNIDPIFIDDPAQHEAD
jgi:L,D-transpeptidase catalytic domain